MPCFKGLAVSIHANGEPLPEYAVQRQSRMGRISTYIPVPPAKIPQDAAQKVEQSTFAISITLLTPGLNVPYSTPKPTPDNPYPRPLIVAGAPIPSLGRGRLASLIGAYAPLTTSPNETIAAYIYFDGRSKEEVATLLRRGEETWVNSRWVGVPESEGGGLAEREFLFREVGLERWLNGLDLEGTDTAAKIERRRKKVEKKRQKKKKEEELSDEEDVVNANSAVRQRRAEKGVLRYGADATSPLEQMSDSDEMLLSESDSDDDPVPESAGQIKVALFRVLASGEIRRGEYSPQFDAHDDSAMDSDKTGQTAGDLDHTTSFSQPKTLDPKSISTQTVTGIDSSDNPFAVFTFLYRGEKQLQKMGIVQAPKKPQEKPATGNGQRRSLADFSAAASKLKPLNPKGLRDFQEFRDPSERGPPGTGVKDKKKRIKDEDSDEDILIKHEADTDEDPNAMLSPEDARRQGELAEGVQKIRLKRQHSTDMTAPSPAPAHRKSPDSNAPTAGSSPLHTAGSPPPLLPSLAFDSSNLNTGPSAQDAIGSPMKRQRSSLPNTGEADIRKRLGLGIGVSDIKADILEQAELANGGAKSAGPRGTLGWDTSNVAPGPVAQDGVGMFGGVLGAPKIMESLPSQEQKPEEKGTLMQQEGIKQEAGPGSEPGVVKQEPKEDIKQEQMDEDEEL